MIKPTTNESNQSYQSFGLLQAMIAKSFSIGIYKINQSGFNVSSFQDESSSSLIFEHPKRFEISMNTTLFGVIAL